jgi:hypothetical protein
MLQELPETTLVEEKDLEVYDAPRLIEHGSIEELTEMSIIP